MSPAASTEVVLVDTPATRSAPTATDGAFWVGFTQKGPATEAIEVTSLDDFEDTYGTEESFAPLWFYAKMFFRFGGTRLTIGRVQGDAAAVATGNLFDQAGSTNPGDIALAVTSVDKSEWANGLNVTVTVAGSDFTITVTHDTDTSVSESSGTLADRAAAVTWAATSEYIRLALGASNEDPRAQAASLTSGTDDHGAADEDNWTAARALFEAEKFGPGQVAAPGRTTDAAHLALFAHAAGFNRFALADAPDTATVATLTAAADAIDAGGDGRYGSLWAPWLLVNSDTPGSTRTIPPSVVMSAMLSRADARGTPRSQPPAGDPDGIINTPVTGLSQDPWDSGDRDDLEDAGVSIFLIDNQQVAAWSNRTVDQSGDPRWESASPMRVLMAMIARFRVIGKRYEHKRLDGKRHKIVEFGNELTAVCKDHYDADDLFGDTPREAYTVDVGPSVNTTTTIQDKRLLASIEVHNTDTVNNVRIELNRRLLTEVL